MSREIREPNSLTSIAFNTGVVLERERIIKLLKDNFADTNLRKEIIAVIKGENK